MQPNDGDTSYASGRRPPAYVIVQWVHPELRDRFPSLGPSLAEALQVHGEHQADAEPEPEAEP